MQELNTEKSFFDWLRDLSGEYGNAMTAWGQSVHDAVSGAGNATAMQRLLQATDTAIDQLVAALMSIGARHDDPGTPTGGARVLEALDRLLGASAELLRDAREGIRGQGLAGLAGLSSRIAELRRLEADVEQATNDVRRHLADTFGNPGTP